MEADAIEIDKLDIERGWPGKRRDELCADK